MTSLKEANQFTVEDLCEIFINKYYNRNPKSPKSLLDLSEKERYIKLLLHGSEESFKEEYGITPEASSIWSLVKELLADLIDLKKPSIEEYEKLCEENNMGYVIIDTFK